MKILDFLFGRWANPARNARRAFRWVAGYTPVFTTWRGSVYESELIRAAIDAHARHAAKLEPIFKGTARPALRARLEKAPNDSQTWPQFLYQATTILYARNTCFIVPITEEHGDTVGIRPICPESWELVEYAGDLWLRFRFRGGEYRSMELWRVGILTRYQYESELFGAGNDVLDPVLDLISIQRQGAKEAAKNSATYRFMATMGNFATDDDLKKERERFDEKNFQQGGGGVLLFPNTYKDVKQVTAQSYAIDAEQTKAIRDSVYDYFGVNEEVIQNKAYGDAWNAFYEGATEWLAVNLTETISRMLFSDRERALGAQLFFGSNRLQYMSNADKLAVIAQMADRGLMTNNELRAILNLPPLEGDLGNMIPARGEYFYVNEETTQTETEEEENAGAL